MKGLPLIHCIILSVLQTNIGMVVSWQFNIIFFSYFPPFSIINFHMNRSRYNMQALRLIFTLAALLLGYQNGDAVVVVALVSGTWNIHCHLQRINCKQSRFLLFAKAVDDDCIITSPTSDCIIVSWDIFVLHLDVSHAISLSIDDYCLWNSFNESSSFYLSGE